MPGSDECPTRSWSVRYPRIISGKLNLYFTFDHPGSILISLYNQLGQKVMNWPLDLKPEIPLDLSRLPQGIYFLKIEGSDQVVVRKVVLVR
ncbi:hypothetical protein DRP53_10100 [candidate division WOR-3 bacterium]|uniref:Secretion system C-terminal sorting domain-containing protein n=1 Tax=candidate division WOR-3 bacterium TaxID=2052148 RepID=A0A660SDW0_UNCW3|nr:MAG: hypothetical protein DRP53_10100 [candidate division WOR-3 bacterium]